MAPPYGSGVILTDGILDSGIHGFLLATMFPREGLQIGYRYPRKRVQGAGCRGNLKEKVRRRRGGT